MLVILIIEFVYQKLEIDTNCLFVINSISDLPVQYQIIFNHCYYENTSPSVTVYSKVPTGLNNLGIHGCPS